MSGKREFGDRYHFQGDGCDEGKCPTDRELPYPEMEPSIAELLERSERASYMMLGGKRVRKLNRGSDV